MWAPVFLCACVCVCVCFCFVLFFFIVCINPYPVNSAVRFVNTYSFCIPLPRSTFIVFLAGTYGVKIISFCVKILVKYLCFSKVLVFVKSLRSLSKDPV